MLRTLLQLSIYSYRRYWLQASFAALAMLCGVAGLVAVLQVNRAAEQNYQQQDQALVSLVSHRIQGQAGALISHADYTSLRRAGFDNLIPTLRARETLTLQSGETQQFSLLGLDLFSIPTSSIAPSATTQHGSAMQTTELVNLWRKPVRTLIHTQWAAELGVQDGDILYLQDRPLPPLLTADIPGLGRELVLDIGQLQQILLRDELSELWLAGNTGSEQLEKLRQQLPSQLSLQALPTTADAEQLTASFHLNILAMGLLMFVVCLFVVMNGLQLLLAKRLEQGKVLRQLGVGRRQIITLLGAETLILVFITSVAGTWAGLVLAGALSPAVQQTLQGLYGLRMGFYQQELWPLYAQALAANALGCLLALGIPLQRLNQHLAQRQSISSNDLRLPGGFWLFAALAFALLSSLLASLNQGLGVSFASIAALIFAGCSALIFVLPRLLRGLFLILPARWNNWRWALADGVQLSRNSKIACCAFFMAICANVGMNLMVDSFRQATVSWLQQRLIGDYYLYPQDLALPPEPAGAKLLGRYSLDAKLQHNNHRKTVNLNSYPTSTDYQQAMVWHKASNAVWSQFEQGQGLLVSEQTARALAVKLGEPIVLEMDNLRQQLPVLGIYKDYGNSQLQALLPLSQLRQDGELQSMALHIDSANPAELDAYLTQLRNTEGVQLFAVDELLALSMQTFERTFAITAVLNTLTLLVAAISLMTSVTLLEWDGNARRALLRAMGLSQGRIFSLLLGQYAIVVLLSCALAIPFGVGLSWLLINLVNVQAFGWSYPLLWQPLSVLPLLLGSTLLMCLGMAIPLYARLKTPLREQLAGLESG